MQNQEVEQKMDSEMKTGTTTLGVVTEDGVILAADRRASIGHLASSKNAKKIYQLDDYIGLTIAGSVGDAQKIVRTMRSQLKLHKLETKELSVRGAGTLLANILHGHKMMPFMGQFVLGGINGGEGKLYDLDPLGGLMESEEFTATGSGSTMAYGLLEDAWEEDMDHDDAKNLAVRAIQSAMERDTASGDGIMVAEITDEGFEILEEKEVESRLE